MAEDNFYSQMRTLSGVERAKSERTLICLLRACQGYKTLVELRNEDTCLGIIENCDGFMNLIIRNAVMTTLLGNQQTFEEVHILGKNIRYVHIPDELDILASIESELEKLNKSRLTTVRTRGRGRARGRGRGRAEGRGGRGMAV